MYSILHISDLHRSPEDTISNAELISALVSDRRRYENEPTPIKAPDAIVVSGDIIQGVKIDAADADVALAAQYATAREFLVELADRFVNGDRSKVVLVPGNHDINWARARSSMEVVAPSDPSFPRDVRGALASSDSAHRWDWKTRELLEIKNQAVYQSRMEAFWDFFDAFYAGTSNLLKVGRGQAANLYSLWNGRIGLAAFDSCHGNDCYAFHGRIPKDAIGRAHLDLLDKGGFGLLLAVWHHNIEGPPHRSDPAGHSVQLMLDVYDREYVAFGHMAKDFVRNVIFPKIADLVPSATRQGADAFLKSVHRTRELFEYETADLENLASLWQDYLNGKITMAQASTRSKAVQRSYQVLDSTVSAAVRDVVPDVVDNEKVIRSDEAVAFSAAPSIQRLDMETPSKLLTIPDDEEPLNGYRCFLALTDRVREERGEFFLQPHRTSVVWGGQKALFIFEHHSGNFGLYYDIQTSDLISSQSGGGSFETSTIVMKNRTFIPVPDGLRASLLPTVGERKKLEVRCDILYRGQVA